MTDTHAPHTKEQWDVLCALYELDIPASATALHELPLDTIETFLARTHTHHALRTDPIPRFFPSTFIAENSYVHYATPFPKRNPWHSLERLIETFTPTTGLMLIAPLYWQTEPIFNDVCKRHGLPESVIHGNNLPVAVEILKQVSIRGVVLEHSLIPSFIEEVTASYDITRLDFILSITPLSELNSVAMLPTVDGSLLFHEVHLSPGCPLLYQDIPDAGSDRFRLNQDFMWELNGQRPRITATTAHTLPTLRFVLPLSLTEDEESGTYKMHL